MCDLWTLLLFSLTLIACSNTNDIVCGNNQCRDSNITCVANEKCDVLCIGTSSCEQTAIHCPSNYECSITCSANSACKLAIIYGTLSSKINLIDCTNGFYTCSGVTIYCPPQTNTKKCILNGDNSLSGIDSNNPMNIYALYGWNDVDISRYNSSDDHYGMMHCTSNYSKTCTFASKAWSCDNPLHICNHLTIAPTTEPTESLIITEEPTIDIFTSTPTVTNTVTASHAPTVLPTATAVTAQQYNDEYKQMAIYLYYNDTLNGINMIYAEYMQQILLKTYEQIINISHPSNTMIWDMTDIVNITFCVVFNRKSYNYNSKICEIFYAEDRGRWNSKEDNDIFKADIQQAQYVAFGTFEIVGAQYIGDYEASIIALLESETFLYKFSMNMNKQLVQFGFKDAFEAVLIVVESSDIKEYDTDEDSNASTKDTTDLLSVSMDIIIMVFLGILATASFIATIYILRYCYLNTKECHKRKNAAKISANAGNEGGAQHNNDISILGKTNHNNNKLNVVDDADDTDDPLQEDDKAIKPMVNNEYPSSAARAKHVEPRQQAVINTKKGRNSQRFSFSRLLSTSLKKKVCEEDNMKQETVKQRRRHKKKRSFHWGFTTENDGETTVYSYDNKHSVQLTLSTNNSEIADNLGVKLNQQSRYWSVNLDDDDVDVDSGNIHQMMEQELSASGSGESMYDSAKSMDGVPLTAPHRITNE